MLKYWGQKMHFICDAHVGIKNLDPVQIGANVSQESHPLGDTYLIFFGYMDKDAMLHL